MMDQIINNNELGTRIFSTSHTCVHCRGCIEKERPNGDTMTKANLNCWLNHGLSKVIVTHLVPRVFLMSITSFIHGKACKKNIDGVLLVKSHDGWRKEMTRWVQEEWAHSDSHNSDSDGEGLGNVMYGHQWSKWLPRSLELLFGGRKEVDVDEQLRRVH